MLATPELIQETRQRSRLEKLLPDWKRVPLYHTFLAQRPVDPDIFAALKDFPLTGKREMRQGFPFLPPGQSLDHLLEQDVVELEHTSGTSEEQLPVLFKRGWWDTQEERALRLNPLVARVLDAHPDARRATLTTPACNGRVCFSAWRARAHRTVGKTLYVNQNRIPFVLTDDNLDHMADEIADWSPKFLDTDPVHAAWFALYCERKGIRFPSLEFILCSYEFVSAVHRRIIERAFGVPVFNLYGSTETGHLLMQDGNSSKDCSRSGPLNQSSCPTFQVLGGRFPLSQRERAGVRENDSNENPLSFHGVGKMKPCYDNAYLEIVSPDARGIGDLVVTTLTNDYMPLLRYRIGDLVECRELPYETTYIVHGRARDAIHAANGDRVTTWDVDQCFRDVAGIAHYQLHQDKDGNCRLRFIPDKNVGGPEADKLKTVVSRLEDLLQMPNAIEIESVEKLPPTPSGKFRLTVREA